MKEKKYCKRCGLIILGRKSFAIYHKECARIVHQEKANARDRLWRQEFKLRKQQQVMVVQQ